MIIVHSLSVGTQIPEGAKQVRIQDANLTSLGGVKFPNSLGFLWFDRCSQLESIHTTYPANLKVVVLSNCPRIVSLAGVNFPRGFEQLRFETSSLHASVQTDFEAICQEIRENRVTHPPQKVYIGDWSVI